MKPLPSLALVASALLVTMSAPIKGQGLGVRRSERPSRPAAEPIASTPSLRVVGRLPDGSPAERFRFQVGPVTEIPTLYTLGSPDVHRHVGPLDLPRAEGAFQITVRDPFFEPTKHGPFRPGELGAELVLDLEPRPTIEGSVRMDGRTVPGAEVELAAPFHFPELCMLASHDPGFCLHSRWQGMTSDESGRFRVPIYSQDPPFREAQLAIRSPHGDYLHGPFSLDALRGLKGVRIDMGTTGSVRGRILPPAQLRIGSIRELTLVTSHGHALRVPVDPQGRFERSGLLPGDWTAQVRSASDQWALTQEVGDDGEFEPADWLHMPTAFEVLPGRVTELELDGVGRRPLLLHADLHVNKGEEPPWETRKSPRLLSPIEPIDSMLFRTGSGSSLLARTAAGTGRFSLAIRDPGEYQVFTWSYLGGPSDLYVSDRIRLEDSATHWSPELELVPVQVFLGRGTTIEGPLVALGTGPGSLRVVNALVPWGGTGESRYWYGWTLPGSVKLFETPVSDCSVLIETLEVPAGRPFTTTVWR